MNHTAHTRLTHICSGETRMEIPLGYAITAILSDTNDNHRIRGLAFPFVRFIYIRETYSFAASAADKSATD